jgi:transglutaminase-like putative cysteine protease
MYAAQVVGGWFPPLPVWWDAIRGVRGALPDHLVASQQVLSDRLQLWAQGAVEGAAVRDDTVLAAFAILVLWLLAGVSVWLLRRGQSGLAASIPLLWPVGLMLLYSPVERWLFLGGLGAAVLLHLLVSHQKTVEQWRVQGLDYDPGLLLERSLQGLVFLALALGLAATLPNAYVPSLAWSYYRLLQPFNEQAETAIQRVFPGVSGVSPWQPGSRGTGGLPNLFLLQDDPDRERRLVMEVRTNEPSSGFGTPPRSTYLRGITYLRYYGTGWDNPPPVERREVGVDQTWGIVSVTGRRSLLQSVRIAGGGSLLYAAAEPVAPSVAAMAVLRSGEDLQQMETGARSYTVRSLVPAVSVDTLTALGDWGAARPLPVELLPYVQTPPSITERVGKLALELTRGKTTLYAQAAAIEQYLRQFEYDLTVGPPPEDVTDIADYFLFELQRGYCDYYATAFVVLARAAGLPARFASGYTSGNWQPAEQLWRITAANAHSWPEVFFPEVGWIPFEPTAARAPLERVEPPRPADTGAMATPEFEPLPSLGLDLRIVTWPMVFGVLGIIGAVAGAIVLWRRRRRQREEPWPALLRWGARAGRPAGEGETPLEYGRALAVWIGQGQGNGDLRRMAAGELQHLSAATAQQLYGPVEMRTMAMADAKERWQRLRALLGRL